MRLIIGTSIYLDHLFHFSHLYNCNFSLYPAPLCQVSYRRNFRQTLRIFFSCGAAAQRGPWLPHSGGFLITHNEASQSVGLLWTSDQLVAETCTWQHTTLKTNIHAPGGIRTQYLSRRTATDLRLRPRAHWERLLCITKVTVRFTLEQATNARRGSTGTALLFH